MSDLDHQIEQLLHRNIFVEAPIKARILALDAPKKREMLTLLQGMEHKQKALFGKILQKDPRFFEKIS